LIDVLKKQNEALKKGILQKSEINIDDYAGYFGGSLTTASSQNLPNSP
jgi:hypothetical protein